jgi:hypothetical protein
MWSSSSEYRYLHVYFEFANIYLIYGPIFTIDYVLLSILDSLIYAMIVK